MILCQNLLFFSVKDGGNNLAELLSSALPAVNNRTYGKENTNLNDVNDGRIDLLLDNSPRSILDTHSTSSSATGSTTFPSISCQIFRILSPHSKH